MVASRAVVLGVIDSITQEAVSIYIHWPYCTKLCTYCNFTKYRVPQHLDQLRMRDCLVQEIQQACMNRARVHSVYFGGGTPSLASPSIIADILNEIGHKLDGNAEVTLEVNPTKIVLPQLREFKAAGINRISVGVQTLDDSQLAVLNRDHTSVEAIQVLMEANRLFPGSVNADLIFGLPGHSLSSFKEGLNILLPFIDSHLSLYQLTVERGTKMARDIRNGVFTLPSEEATADMYEQTVQKLKKIGLLQYEVSNFARPGSESRHNLFYWLGGDYLGIGTGAHSRFKQPSVNGYIRAINILSPGKWMEAVEKNGCGIGSKKEMTERERLEEVIVTSLRTSTGLHRAICAYYGCNIHEVINRMKQEYHRYWKAGLLENSGDVVKATDRGLQVLDQMLPQLVQCL